MNDPPFRVVHEILCDDIGISRNNNIAIDLIQTNTENQEIFFSAR